MHTAAAVVLYATDRAGVQPIGSRLSPAHTGLLDLAAKQPQAAQVCRLSGLHPRNPRNHTNYYSITDPKGMEG